MLFMGMVILAARCFCFLFFFLLLRPPPTSTLFPYTTLFRSHPITFEAFPDTWGWGEVVGIAVVFMISLPVIAQAIGDAEDRKSTRLNSSHGYISYAVFCLKKKKKQPHSTSVSHRSAPLETTA